ncbi:MAG: hypothetical protein KDI05_09330 [Halieaceae bacterium]|nr:hypothetical protein [Halieaceae bacterium]
MKMIIKRIAFLTLLHGLALPAAAVSPRQRPASFTIDQIMESLYEK